VVRRALFLASALAGLGCNAILGIDYGEPKPKPPIDSGAPDTVVPSDDASPDTSLDASPDVSPDTSADASVPDASIDAVEEMDIDPLCPIRWPPPPDTDDGVGEGGAPGDIELAAETLVLDPTLPDSSVPNVDLGLDLDGRCTCHPHPASCVPHAGRADLQCDESGGRDIMANKFLQSWVALGETALSQDALRSDLAHGRAGTLLRIDNYNGLANDKFVVVEFFGRAWIPPVGSVYLPTAKDGSDEWSVYTSSVVGVSTALEQDVAAYVKDHVLVARLVTATIALRPNTGMYDNPLIVEFHDAVLMGTLVPTDRGFRLASAQLAGRWPAQKALLSFSALADANGFLCGNHPFAGLLQTQVCDNLDISSQRANDNTGTMCDSMSIAIGFEAGPAHVGPAKDPPVVPNNCPAGWNPTCAP
jgi:hypothetical protein